MAINLRSVAVAGGLLTAMAAAEPALAQKPGGILRLSHFDSPASISILEESTVAALRPAMGVFNNLVSISRMCRKPACNRSYRTWRPARKWHNREQVLEAEVHAERARYAAAAAAGDFDTAVVYTGEAIDMIHDSESHQGPYSLSQRA